MLLVYSLIMLIPLFIENLIHYVVITGLKHVKVASSKYFLYNLKNVHYFTIVSRLSTLVLTHSKQRTTQNTVYAQVSF